MSNSVNCLSWSMLNIRYSAVYSTWFQSSTAHFNSILIKKMAVDQFLITAIFLAL